MNLLEQNFVSGSENQVDILTSAELKSMDDAGLSVYLYSDDSLVYWSTNTFSAPNFSSQQPKISYPSFQRTVNGWYIIFRQGNQDKMVEGRILIKHEYPFENDYLNNSFQNDFHVPKGTILTKEPGKLMIFSPEKKYLFSLKIPEEPPVSRENQLFLFFLYIMALLVLFTSWYQLLFNVRYIRTKLQFILVFTAGIVLARFIQVSFKIPDILYNTSIFGPESFSSSFFFPSLGDFLVNALSFLVISWVIYRMLPGKINRPESNVNTFLLFLLFLVILAGEVFAAVYLLKDLVVNSTIPFNLQDVSSLNFYSFIGFVIISTVFLSLFFIGIRIVGFMTILMRMRNRRWIKGVRLRKYSVTNLVGYLIFFSVFATGTLNYYNEKVEKEKRKLLAIKLAAEKDPQTEMMFSRIEPSIRNDNFLNHLLKENVEPDSIIRYMRRRYFNDYWNNFSLQITRCTEERILRVQPQNYLVQCDNYFQTLIRAIGQPTISRDFYFLDYGYGFKNYLFIFPYEAGANDSLKAYFELSSKLVLKDLGYPELLLDKRQIQFPDLSGYSYAFYRQGRLVNRVGNFHYSMNLAVYPETGKESQKFFSAQGLNHYRFNIDENRTLIISKKENNFFDKISPFSYLFLLFGLIAILFYVIISFPSIFRSDWFSLGARLQLTMSLVLVTSLIIIGLLMMVYINRFNVQKNYDSLSDRAHSMLVELQHKLGNVDSFSTSNQDLEELLMEFSNVFFSDVNIYDTNGRLIATSRKEIFAAGLLSSRMNGEAFRNMAYRHSSYFLTNEKLCNSSYSSAYMPFYNEKNRLLAYLNLPYFTRQEEPRRELSSFLIAFINIYVFLIIVGLVTSLFVSKYITRPLRLLTANIGRLGYGRKNEKLEWSRNDEVGKLVEEYNRMVNELEKSAGLLARSERESAWREMARQVAHEIKNPLTPMKLSVQHLQRAWKDKAPDWEERLRRFTDTMTEQIETLAVIASEFSDFAKMPAKEEEMFDIQDVIEKSIALYRDIDTVHFIFNHTNGPQYIFADRKQINRVFTNLLNNAIYAIGDKNEGIITISVVAENDSVLVTLSDNGSGISREQAEHIFQPNFTTKSGGMGLGLAIVKSIVQGTEGEIHFHSEEGKGTTFMLRFPSTKNITLQR
ncbi:MAG: ATP-binding protein [Syntrophothermus sp.]